MSIEEFKRLLNSTGPAPTTPPPPTAPLQTQEGNNREEPVAAPPTPAVTPDAVLPPVIEKVDFFGGAMSLPVADVLKYDGGKELIDVIERDKKGARGFGESFTDVSTENIPFLGDVLSIAIPIKELRRIPDILQRIDKGEPVDPQEMVYAQLYLSESDREARQTWTGKAGDIVRMMPTYGAEIFIGAKVTSLIAGSAGLVTGPGAAATGTLGAVVGGLGAAARRIIKEGAEEIAERYVKKESKEYLAKFAAKTFGERVRIRAAGAVVGGTVTTGIKAGLESAVNIVSGGDIGSNKKSIGYEINGVLTGNERYLQDSKWLALGSNWTEYMSEFTGGLFDEFLGVASRRLIKPAVAGTTATQTGQQFRKALVRTFGEPSDFKAGIKAKGATKITGLTGTDKQSMTALSGIMVARFMNKLNVDADTALKLLKKAGYDGMLQEMGEERLGGFVHGLLGTEGDIDSQNRMKNAIDQTWWEDVDEFKAEVLAFSLPMFGVGAIHKAQASEWLGGVGITQHGQKLNTMRSSMQPTEGNYEVTSEPGVPVESHYDSNASIEDGADATGVLAKHQRNKPKVAGIAGALIDYAAKIAVAAQTFSLEPFRVDATDRILNMEGLPSLVGTYLSVYEAAKTNLEATHDFRNEVGATDEEKAANSAQSIEDQADALAHQVIVSLISSMRESVSLRNSDIKAWAKKQGIKDADLTAELIRLSDSENSPIDKLELPNGNISFRLDLREIDKEKDDTADLLYSHAITTLNNAGINISGGGVIDGTGLPREGFASLANRLGTVAPAYTLDDEDFNEFNKASLLNKPASTRGLALMQVLGISPYGKDSFTKLGEQLQVIKNRRAQLPQVSVWGSSTVVNNSTNPAAPPARAAFHATQIRGTAPQGTSLVPRYFVTPQNESAIIWVNSTPERKAMFSSKSGFTAAALDSLGIADTGNTQIPEMRVSRPISIEHSDPKILLSLFKDYSGLTGRITKDTVAEDILSQAVGARKIGKKWSVTPGAQNKADRLTLILNAGGLEYSSLEDLFEIRAKNSGLYQRTDEQQTFIEDLHRAATETLDSTPEFTTELLNSLSHADRKNMEPVIKMMLFMGLGVSNSGIANIVVQNGFYKKLARLGRSLGGANDFIASTLKQLGYMTSEGALEPDFVDALTPGNLLPSDMPADIASQVVSSLTRSGEAPVGEGVDATEKVEPGEKGKGLPGTVSIKELEQAATKDNVNPGNEKVDKAVAPVNEKVDKKSKKKAAPVAKKVDTSVDKKPKKKAAPVAKKVNAPVNAPVKGLASKVRAANEGNQFLDDVEEDIARLMASETKEIYQARVSEFAELYPNTPQNVFKDLAKPLLHRLVSEFVNTTPVNAPETAVPETAVPETTAEPVLEKEPTISNEDDFQPVEANIREFRGLKVAPKLELNLEGRRVGALYSPGDDTIFVDPEGMKIAYARYKTKSNPAEFGFGLEKGFENYDDFKRFVFEYEALRGSNIKPKVGEKGAAFNRRLNSMALQNARGKAAGRKKHSISAAIDKDNGEKATGEVDRDMIAVAPEKLRSSRRGTPEVTEERAKQILDKIKGEGAAPAIPDVQEDLPGFVDNKEDASPIAREGSQDELGTFALLQTLEANPVLAHDLINIRMNRTLKHMGEDPASLVGDNLTEDQELSLDAAFDHAVTSVLQGIPDSGLTEEKLIANYNDGVTLLGTYSREKLAELGISQRTLTDQLEGNPDDVAEDIDDGENSFSSQFLGDSRVKDFYRTGTDPLTQIATALLATESSYAQARVTIAGIAELPGIADGAIDSVAEFEAWASAQNETLSQDQAFLKYIIQSLGLEATKDLLGTHQGSYVGKVAAMTVRVGGRAKGKGHLIGFDYAGTNDSSLATSTRAVAYFKELLSTSRGVKAVVAAVGSLKTRSAYDEYSVSNATDMTGLFNTLFGKERAWLNFTGEYGEEVFKAREMARFVGFLKGSSLRTEAGVELAIRRLTEVSPVGNNINDFDNRNMRTEPHLQLVTRLLSTSVTPALFVEHPGYEDKRVPTIVKRAYINTVFPSSQIVTIPYVTFLSSTGKKTVKTDKQVSTRDQIDGIMKGIWEDKKNHPVDTLYILPPGGKTTMTGILVPRYITDTAKDFEQAQSMMAGEVLPKLYGGAGMEATGAKQYKRGSQFTTAGKQAVEFKGGLDYPTDILVIHGTNIFDGHISMLDQVMDDANSSTRSTPRASHILKAHAFQMGTDGNLAFFKGKYMRAMGAAWLKPFMDFVETSKFHGVTDEATLKLSGSVLPEDGGEVREVVIGGNTYKASVIRLTPSSFVDTTVFDMNPKASMHRVPAPAFYDYLSTAGPEMLTWYANHIEKVLKELDGSLGADLQISPADAVALSEGIPYIREMVRLGAPVSGFSLQGFVSAHYAGELMKRTSPKAWGARLAVIPSGGTFDPETRETTYFDGKNDEALTTYSTNADGTRVKSIWVKSNGQGPGIRPGYTLNDTGDIQALVNYARAQTPENYNAFLRELNPRDEHNQQPTRAESFHDLLEPSTGDFMYYELGEISGNAFVPGSIARFSRTPGGYLQPHRKARISRWASTRTDKEGRTVAGVEPTVIFHPEIQHAASEDFDGDTVHSAFYITNPRTRQVIRDTDRFPFKPLPKSIEFRSVTNALETQENSETMPRDKWYAVSSFGISRDNGTPTLQIARDADDIFPAMGAMIVSDSHITAYRDFLDKAETNDLLDIQMGAYHRAGLRGATQSIDSNFFSDRVIPHPHIKGENTTAGEINEIAGQDGANLSDLSERMRLQEVGQNASKMVFMPPASYKGWSFGAALNRVYESITRHVLAGVGERNRLDVAALPGTDIAIPEYNMQIEVENAANGGDLLHNKQTAFMNLINLVVDEQSADPIAGHMGLTPVTLPVFIRVFMAQQFNTPADFQTFLQKWIDWYYGPVGQKYINFIEQSGTYAGSSLTNPPVAEADRIPYDDDIQEIEAIALDSRASAAGTTGISFLLSGYKFLKPVDVHNVHEKLKKVVKGISKRTRSGSQFISSTFSALATINNLAFANDIAGTSRALSFMDTATGEGYGTVERAKLAERAIKKAGYVESVLALSPSKGLQLRQLAESIAKGINALDTNALKESYKTLKQEQYNRTDVENRRAGYDVLNVEQLKAAATTAEERPELTLVRLADALFLHLQREYATNEKFKFDLFKEMTRVTGDATHVGRAFSSGAISSRHRDTGISDESMQQSWAAWTNMTKQLMVIATDGMITLDVHPVSTIPAAKVSIEIPVATIPYLFAHYQAQVYGPVQGAKGGSFQRHIAPEFMIPLNRWVFDNASEALGSSSFEHTMVPSIGIKVADNVKGVLLHPVDSISAGADVAGRGNIPTKTEVNESPAKAPATVITNSAQAKAQALETYAIEEARVEENKFVAQLQGHVVATPDVIESLAKANIDVNDSLIPSQAQTLVGAARSAGRAILDGKSPRSDNVAAFTNKYQAWLTSNAGFLSILERMSEDTESSAENIVAAVDIWVRKKRITAHAARQVLDWVSENDRSARKRFLNVSGLDTPANLSISGNDKKLTQDTLDLLVDNMGVIDKLNHDADDATSTSASAENTPLSHALLMADDYFHRYIAPGADLKETGDSMSQILLKATSNLNSIRRRELIWFNDNKQYWGLFDPDHTIRRITGTSFKNKLESVLGRTDESKVYEHIHKPWGVLRNIPGIKNKVASGKLTDDQAQELSIAEHAASYVMDTPLPGKKRTKKTIEDYEAAALIPSLILNVQISEREFVKDLLPTFLYGKWAKAVADIDKAYDAAVLKAEKGAVVQSKVSRYEEAGLALTEKVTNFTKWTVPVAWVVEMTERTTNGTEARSGKEVLVAAGRDAARISVAARAKESTDKLDEVRAEVNSLVAPVALDNEPYVAYRMNYAPHLWGAGFLGLGERALRIALEKDIDSVLRKKQSEFESIIGSPSSISSVSRPLEKASFAMLRYLLDLHGHPSAFNKQSELVEAIRKGDYEAAGIPADLDWGGAVHKIHEAVTARLLVRRATKSKMDAALGIINSPLGVLHATRALLRKGILNESTARAYGRTQGDTFKAAFIESGRMPANIGSTDAVHKYINDVASAATNKLMLNQALRLRAPGGYRMYFAHPGAEGLDNKHSLFTKDFWAAQLNDIIDTYDFVPDPNLSVKQNTAVALSALVAKNDQKRPGDPVYKRLDSPFTSVLQFYAIQQESDSTALLDSLPFVGGEAAGYLKHITERPYAYNNAALTAIETFNNWAKMMAMQASLFFTIAALEGLQAGLKGTLWTKAGWVGDHKTMGLIELYQRMQAREPTVMGLIDIATNAHMELSDVSNAFDLPIGVVEKNIRQLVDLTEKFFGKKTADNVREFTSLPAAQANLIFGAVFNTSKLFYLNRLLEEDKKRSQELGLKFDVNRTARRIGRIVDDSMGGENINRFSYMTPWMKRLTSLTWFSWSWTRAAWAIAGGGLVTGHLFKDIPTEEHSKFVFLRNWPHMILHVLILPPILLQAGAWLLAGGDDDDDEPFMWNNETGHRLHADITPLMRKFGWYQGAPTGSRRQYIHWGKQAYEVTNGWMEKPWKTLLSKLSRVGVFAAEQLTGETLGNEWDLGFKDQGMAGLLMDEYGDFDGSRLGHALNFFTPFSILGFIQQPDARPLSFIGPASKGMGFYKASSMYTQILNTWSRKATYKDIYKSPLMKANLDALGAEILTAAELNGYKKADVIRAARSAALKTLYTSFYKSLNAKDYKKLEEIASSIARVHGTVDSVMRSVTSRDSRRNVSEDRTPEDLAAIQQAFNQP